MGTSDVISIIEKVERLLAEEELSEKTEQAIQELLNVVEALCADKQSLADEVERLRKQLEQKKKAKNNGNKGGQNPPGESDNVKSDHSSEKRRKSGKKPKANDRRSFKDLTIHDTVKCPVDPDTLPPDAVRFQDEIVVVQDIEIKPKNTQFQRQVFYSASQKKYYRGPLPAGFDHGDFSASLRALIVSLKYCGNMSEPKIGEFLNNFDVQVSAGSLSNILTKSAKLFDQEYDDLLIAGLSSTPYQQTDDTSARVKGEFWNTHILCNPFYTFYSTRPGKDRLTVLKVLQNTDDLRFYFGEATCQLLQDEFMLPKKWSEEIAALGEVEVSETTLKLLLDGWFGQRNQQVRTTIEQAAAIVFYRQQSSIPVVQTLVCDDAGQFKLLTDKLSLCWIHAGRHYEKLSPVVDRHTKSLDDFRDRYWAYYASLQDYRAGPTRELAQKLLLKFDELFSTQTKYEALDDRIAKTAAKKDELLTVLSVPEVPLHNNASELGARVSARRRDVSLHSCSERGVHAMDIFTTLVQTSKKLRVSAFAYLRDRLSGALKMPSLAQSILQSAQNADAIG
ncbi:MAG: transposase [Gammaproteobacteria bacterium]|nr:transposase [Gammaproteobacteria bacterium]